MSSYMQMGSQTKNLVGEKDLDAFSGIVLSPLNYSPEDTRQQVCDFRRNSYDIILDPQLYYPDSERGQLSCYSYFPSDLNTADLSSAFWWSSTVSKLASYAMELGPDAVASPVIRPKRWNLDFFAQYARIAGELKQKLPKQNMRVLATVLVNLMDLVEDDFVMKVASIVAQYRVDGYYLVFVSDTQLRRELDNPDEIAGAMRLVYELENTGFPVTVAFSSSDMLLWKAAGASHCGTGKHFCLRRFTSSRYEEPPFGHGQLPYWFEHSLLSFLREADVWRLLKEGKGPLVNQGPSSNYWSATIQAQWSNDPGKAWVGVGWRQYLSWFSKAEQLITGSDAELVKQWLKVAEANWQSLSADEFIMEEPENDGHWIRHWRIALRQFQRSLVA